MAAIVRGLVQNRSDSRVTGKEEATGGWVGDGGDGLRTGAGRGRRAKGRLPNE